MLFKWTITLPSRRRREARHFFHPKRSAEFGTSPVRTEGLSAFGQWLACLWDDRSFSPLKRCPVVVPAPPAVPRRGSRR